MKNCSLVQTHVTQIPEQPEIHFVRAEDITFLVQNAKNQLNFFVVVGRSLIAKSIPSLVITDRICSTILMDFKPDRKSVV